MATKTATKKTVAKKTASKSLTPLLDQAKAVNPHKPEWNRAVADALQTELKAVLNSQQWTPDELLHFLADYGPLSGWKDVAKLIVKRFDGETVK